MGLDRLIERVLGGLKWLALPVAALLFLQWPLRELVRAWSRDANDLGQWLFALFVAASVVAATRHNAHLASDAAARWFSDRTRQHMAMLATLLAVVPWAMFVAWAGAPQIAGSILGRERFPDTGNFGYFVLKAALLLMLVLVLMQALVDAVRWLGSRRDRA